jgi:hypothetical protein
MVGIVTRDGTGSSVNNTPTNDCETSLTDYMEMCARARSRGRRWDKLVFACVEEYLVRYGVFMTPALLPLGVRPMPLSQCYENAFRLASRTKAFHYVEGIALGIMPLHHAWCVDQDGNVIDPTWAIRDQGDKPYGQAYFGVELSLDEVRRSRRGGRLTVLFDWVRDYPALQDADVRAKDSWFKR